jgi:hypothetical protein
VFLGLLQHHILAAAAAQSEIAVTRRVRRADNLYFGRTIRFLTNPNFILFEIHLFLLSVNHLPNNNQHIRNRAFSEYVSSNCPSE